ncbi:MAG TPA: hypothetical protein PLI09_02590 [Candidatus Hydrogenedentes bacterium]|nr:hypothetical protein [Candidatus Hydrogenedentota bacterium]
MLLTIHLHHGVKRDGTVFRMNKVQEPVILQLPQGIAQGDFPLLVHAPEIPLRVRYAKQIQRGVEIAVKFFGFFPQCGFRGLYPPYGLVGPPQEFKEKCQNYRQQQGN